MTENEAHAQAFENGRKVGDAEGYASGLGDAYAAAGDLISRKALIEDIKKRYCGPCKEAKQDYNEVRCRACWVDDMCGEIEEAPAVKAVPVKHGRWVDHCVRDWRCSECGEKIIKVRNVDGYCYDDKPNYCPNCGADMRGGIDA